MFLQDKEQFEGTHSSDVEGGDGDAVLVPALEPAGLSLGPPPRSSVAFCVASWYGGVVILCAGCLRGGLAMFSGHSCRWEGGAGRWCLGRVHIWCGRQVFIPPLWL